MRAKSNRLSRILCYISELFDTTAFTLTVGKSLQNSEMAVGSIKFPIVIVPPIHSSSISLLFRMNLSNSSTHARM